MAEPRDYREFWPVYVRAHRHPVTQWVHFLASVTGAVFSVAAFVSSQPLLVLCGILAGYLIALSSHRLVEGNWPTALRHPLWSALADLQMCFLLTTGRMSAETRKFTTSTEGASQTVWDGGIAGGVTHP
jgi:hypothetical protein